MYNNEIKLDKNIIYFEEIDSTQKEIWRLFEKNKIKDSLVVITKKQINGIGTHGRKWINESDRNILFSIGINFENIDLNEIKINVLDGLTIQIAEMLIEVFKEIYNISSIKIKAPNDLILNDRKIGGILTETKLQGNNLKRLVLGIGINTNQIDFNDKEIKDIATSLKKELKISIDNDLVIKFFIKKLEKNLIKRIVR